MFYCPFLPFVHGPTWPTKPPNENRGIRQVHTFRCLHFLPGFHQPALFLPLPNPGLSSNHEFRMIYGLRLLLFDVIVDCPVSYVRPWICRLLSYLRPKRSCGSVLWAVYSVRTRGAKSHPEKEMTQPVVAFFTVIPRSRCLLGPSPDHLTSALSCTENPRSPCGPCPDHLTSALSCASR